MNSETGEFKCPNYLMKNALCNLCGFYYKADSSLLKTIPKSNLEILQSIFSEIDLAVDTDYAPVKFCYKCRTAASEYKNRNRTFASNYIAEWLPITAENHEPSTCVFCFLKQHFLHLSTSSKYKYQKWQRQTFSNVVFHRHEMNLRNELRPDSSFEVPHMQDNGGAMSHVIDLSDSDEESHRSKEFSDLDAEQGALEIPTEPRRFESGVPKQQVASKSTKYKKPPQDNNSKFMEDFEPSLSVRELRKHQRKSYSEAKIPVTKVIGSMYDEKGVLRDNQIDLCDCLSTTCHGCHFPCPSCKSPKCGFVCRCNRKWMYEHIEFDGKDEIIKNPLYKSFNY